MLATHEFTFATSNVRKLLEARAVCEPYGITIVQGIADLDEIQGTDPRAIAVSKAEQAYAQLGTTVVVNDSAWAIEAVGGFPGAYMHDVNQWFTPDDFLALMRGKENRRVVLTDTIVQLGRIGTSMFTQETEGYISLQARGNSGPASDRVIVLGDQQDRTIAERREAGEIVSDGMVELWTKFCVAAIQSAQGSQFTQPY